MNHQLINESNKMSKQMRTFPCYVLKVKPLAALMVSVIESDAPYTGTTKDLVTALGSNTSSIQSAINELKDAGLVDVLGGTRERTITLTGKFYSLIGELK